MHKISINCAPVLTLWATVVAERLGYKHDEALTLAKALTDLTTQAHDQAFGIINPKPAHGGADEEKDDKVREAIPQQFGKKIAVTRTKEGLRAVSNGKLIEPANVERYLASKFGDVLPDARDVMEKLARSVPPNELSANAYKLYGRFVPKVASGAKGGGAKCVLDLDLIRSLASKAK